MLHESSNNAYFNQAVYIGIELLNKLYIVSEGGGCLLAVCN